MIRGTPEHEVEILFDAEFANTVADTQWHKTQEVEFHEDGSATFRCTVAGLDEIVWWVLSMGPHCEVRAPDELRERVRTAAMEMALRYTSTG
jgi:predicted DNA-binding transcriptional regulator YafY